MDFLIVKKFYKITLQDDSEHIICCEENFVNALGDIVKSYEDEGSVYDDVFDMLKILTNKK